MADETSEQYEDQNGEKDNLQMDVKEEPSIQCFIVEAQENNFENCETSDPLPSTADVSTANLWTTKATNCLITKYKKYRSLVGQSTRIRTLREMFEMISVEMQKYGYYFTPQKCENKWRVLERKYKNLVIREKAKKPGRMRHYGHWEHKRALDEIFNDRRKHFYIEVDEIPPNNRVGPQTETADTTDSSKGHRRRSQKSSSGNNDPSTPRTQATPNQTEPLVGVLEKFLENMKQNFEIAEKNKERRHKEEMALMQSQLEIQKKLLELEEQKMALQKSQMLAAAQHIHLKMSGV